jgi:hypothetical protein
VCKAATWVRLKGSSIHWRAQAMCTCAPKSTVCLHLVLHASEVSALPGAVLSAHCLSLLSAGPELLLQRACLDAAAKILQTTSVAALLLTQYAAHGTAGRKVASPLPGMDVRVCLHPAIVQRMIPVSRLALGDCRVQRQRSRRAAAGRGHLRFKVPLNTCRG